MSTNKLLLYSFFLKKGLLVAYCLFFVGALAFFSGIFKVFIFGIVPFHHNMSWCGFFFIYHA